ncbi:MAG: hypothetical protein IJN48_04740, partial [Clostridia bacterium]|nr:hypothetical protein [Clostridia bacterium]
MKRILSVLLVSIILVMCLSGCKQEIRSDFLPSNYGYGWTGLNEVMAGDGGYYYTKSNAIMYADLATGKNIYLCSKPECDHANGYCISNSYNVATFDAAKYDGYIYVTAMNLDYEEKNIEYILQRVDLRGTERSTVAKYYTVHSENMKWTQISEMILHRGKAIINYGIAPYDFKDGMETYLFIVDLDRKTSEKIIPVNNTGKPDISGAVNLCADGDYVYYTVTYDFADYESGGGMLVRPQHVTKLYRLSLKNDETEELPLPDRFTDYTVSKGKVYYTTFADGEILIHCYDTKSGSSAMISGAAITGASKYTPHIMTDKEYLYVAAYGRSGTLDNFEETKRDFYIFSLEGEQLAKFDLPEGTFSEEYALYENTY